MPTTPTPAPVYAAAPGPSARFWRGWGAALAMTGALLLLVALPPVVGPAPRAVLMQLFSALCHQIPARSPHVDGVALAVCHRCFGIYLGLFAAVCAYPLLRSRAAHLGRAARLWIPAALLPPGVDWLGGVFGLWTNTPASRLLTGAVFGLVAGAYLARALTSARRTSAESEAEAAS